MTQVPEGAQRSEDGNYWWDETANQWQPIQGGGATPAPAGGEAATPGSAGGGAAPAGAAGGAAGGDAAAAPQRPADAQPIHEVALLEGGQVDVPEISSEQGEHEGEGSA